MFRKEILSIFYNNLKIDKNGRYLIELNNESCFLEVEDTVFVVSAVYKTRRDNDSSDFIYILLNDDSWEKLDLNNIYAGKDHVLYCLVKKGAFPARFSRKSYYQLAEYIEEEENAGSFFIEWENRKYFIHNDLSQ